MIVLVTNRRMAGAGMVERIEEALAGGVSQIILREKDMERDDLITLGAQIKKVAEPWGASLFINSQPEIAIEVARHIGAEGIHLPYEVYQKWVFEKTHPESEQSGQMKGTGETVGSTETEKFQGKSGDSATDLKIGVSIHRIEEVRNILSPPDYFLLGNIFETACKEGLAGKGLPFLETVCKEASPVPVIGIGGISPENIRGVKATGAAGAAVMGAFMTGKEPRELAKKLSEGFL